jgi:putative ABC transport system substrate-binding protein
MSQHDAEPGIPSVLDTCWAAAQRALAVRPSITRLSIVVTLLLCAAPLATEAQSATVPRIGILSSANPRSASIYQAFEQRLRELGYVEGQNVAIEFRNAEGRFDRLPDLALELVRLNVNAIVSASPPATHAATKATANIPIVMLAVNYDPIALGYIASLARPGTNVTGLFFQHRELTAKRFELFREMLPTVGRVTILTDSLTVDQLAEVEAANRSVGLQLQPNELRNSPYDFETVFRGLIRPSTEAVFALESAPIYHGRTRLAQLAMKNSLPTSFAFREYVEAGGLMSYGVNFLDMWRRAAEYVDKVVKGAKPANLPVEQPTKFELVINSKTAKALRLTIPRSLLLRADHVVQ